MKPQRPPRSPHPASGNAGIVPRLATERHCPGRPEPGRWATLERMHKSLKFLLALCWPLYLGHAQEVVPAIRILPEDIVHGSVQQFHVATNKFTVRWTYTEAGAKKMLAFWEQHTGQKARTQVGSFETPFGVVALHDPATYPAWREGWVKHRTDKFFGVSQEDAKRIVAGLEGR